ncbi:MAG: beta-galactosidase [Spirochaetes bacterium]|nr:beta-galactosidase [Spirochaetota bacterium]
MENRLKKIIFGVPYNPENWPEESWYQDMEFMKKSGINTVIINTFGWSLIEPSEGEFNFRQLDKIVSMLEENNLYIGFSTSTAFPPAWALKKYEGMHAVNKFSPGSLKSGVSLCPNSPDYIRLIKKLVSAVAVKFGNRNNVIMWNINHGNDVIKKCYCKNCNEAFSNWLQKKYHTIIDLNKAWNSNSCSPAYTEFNDIPFPENSQNTLHLADYDRFMDYSFLNLFNIEKEIIKKHSGIPVTSCFANSLSSVDYFKWKKEIDFVSGRSFQQNYEEKEIAGPMMHDIFRGIQGGEPFTAAGISPDSINFSSMSRTRYPGKLRMICYEAIAHGADAVIFSEWRQPLSGPDKFNSAIINHSGKSDTRIFSETEQLGAELKRLSAVTDSKVNSDIAVVIDFENIRALSSDSLTGRTISYEKCISEFYKVIFSLNQTVDFICSDSDFNDYKIIIAPMMFMIKDKFVSSAENFVKQGGTFITTFLTGLTDENCRVYQESYPGRLKNLLGIKIEEFEKLDNDADYSVSFKGESKQFKCGKWAEFITVAEAKVLAVYNEGIYEKQPAVTINKINNGRAVYISTVTSTEFLTKIMELEFDLRDVKPAITVPKDVKSLKRVKNNGKEFLFLLNYGNKSQKISLGYGKYRDMLSGEILTREIKIDALDVIILGEV